MRWVISVAAVGFALAVVGADNFTSVAVSNLKLNTTAAAPWLTPRLDIRRSNGTSVCDEHCSNFEIDAGEGYSLSWRPRGMFGWPFLPSPDWTVTFSSIFAPATCPLCGSNVSCTVAGVIIPSLPCWAFLVPVWSQKVTVPVGIQIPIGGFFEDNSIVVHDANGHQRLELTFDLDLEGGWPGRVQSVTVT